MSDGRREQVGLEVRPPPPSAEQQLEKLSTDLVEAYEALTLVYRTVSNLGGLFRVEDITAYLVNRSREAVEASGGVLYLCRGDGTFEAQNPRNALPERLAPDAPARLLELGRPLFFHGELAAEFGRPGTRPIRHLLATPLETGGRTLGLLVLERDVDRRFTTGDAKLVSALAGLTAVAVANFQHYRAISYEREMLEGVIREIGDGIVVTDCALRSRLTNEAARQFLGVADAAPEGYDVLERLSTYELSVNREELRDHGQSARDFTARSLDQRRPMVLACKMFSARLGAEAEAIRVVCMRDVTAEHRAQMAQREFMALAAHKLRTPLTKILGLLPLARDPDVEKGLKDEAFGGIESGAEELRCLVDGVLQFVEFRLGKGVIQPVDLKALAAAATEAVRDRRRGRVVEARIDVDPATPLVLGSCQMLLTMLEQLIDNAVKFTSGRNAAVVVRIGPLGADRVQVAVEDRGEGIAPDLLRRLFRPFAQRDEEFTGQAEGAGLGLLLVRQVVERHGGRLSAESTPGLGSRFVAVIRARNDEGS